MCRSAGIDSAGEIRNDSSWMPYSSSLVVIYRQLGLCGCRPFLWSWGAWTTAPFAIQRPWLETRGFPHHGVCGQDLGFPLGMAQLADGSLLVTVAQGTS